jgi:hypothetical protein
VLYRADQDGNAAGVIAPPKWLWLAVALIWAVAVARMQLALGRSAWDYSLLDPDNYTRLQQVRDLLAGQSWWDLHQWRVDPPRGTLIHWSRLADLPFLLTFWIVTPFAGGHAEQVALLATPMWLVGLAFLFQARASAAVGGVWAGVAAAAYGALASRMLLKFLPGNIDHHAPQIVLLLGATAALIAGRGARAGLAAGTACAASLLVGLELLPHLGLVGLWVVAVWVARGDERRGLTLGYFAGLAGGTALLAALTVAPSQWLLPWTDVAGRGHLLAALLFGTAFAAAVALVRGDWRARFAVAGSIALVGGAVLLLLLTPEVIASPFVHVDPVLKRLWFDNVQEVRSARGIWRKSELDAIGLYGPLLFAVAAGGWQWTRLTGARRDGMALATALTAVALAIGLWQHRGTVAAYAVAAIPASVALAAVWTGGRAGLGAKALALLLLTSSTFPAVLDGGRAAWNSAHPTPAKAASRDVDCMVDTRAWSAWRGRPGLVLGGTDLGSMTLVATRNSVLGIGMHRNNEPNRFIFDLFMAPPERAHVMAVSRGGDYLLWCQNGAEGGIWRKAGGPKSLAEALERREPLPWLERQSLPGAKHLELYRIKR